MIEDYGRRLLPAILQYEAQNNPQKLFALVARSDNVEDGFDRVTYRQMTNATNYVSKWLLERFEHGHAPSDCPTLAYIGPNDLRYSIIFYGAIQCRYKVLLPSPRNLVDVNISLLEQTGCVKLVHTTELASLATSLQKASGSTRLQCEQLPTLRELLDVRNVKYPYDFKYADIYKEPILILHSSGSTGKPKPVMSTHGSFATVDVRDWPTVPGRRNFDIATAFRFPEPGGVLYDVFPCFHLAGFYVRVVVPLINGTASIFDPTSRPPSGTLVAKTIRLCGPRILFFPPTILEQLCQERDCDELLKGKDLVCYAGGPLSDETGSRISKLVALCQFFGSTEMGQVRQLQPLRDDWAYLEFHPKECFDLQPLERDSDLHEMVVFTGAHLERTSALYHNFPKVAEWRTKDLFKQHPTKPHLWKFQARTDDILVYSSGQKLNPIPAEVYLTAVPKIKGALVVGTGRSRSALILELDTQNTFTDPQRELWPSIETANTFLSSHGRVTKGMVVVASPEKPFVRAPKGSIVRRLTEQLYADEIRSLYNELPEKMDPNSICLKPAMFHVDGIKAFLQRILNQIALADQLQTNQNLFECGLDSVRTAELVNILKVNMLPYKSERELYWLSLETIYLNPTIDELSCVLLDFLINDRIPVKLDGLEEMKTKIAKFTPNIERRHPAVTVDTVQESERYSIAITGTTGFFGQYLLSNLVKCPEISRIYCLNRSSNAQDKFERLELRHNAEVIFLRMDISSPKLGLSDGEYDVLLRDCTIILHNAWSVDFNLPLGSFNVHLKGIENIIMLCAESALPMRLMFISSIGASGVWTSIGSPAVTIQEKVSNIENITSGMDLGYARSKYVAEHILNNAVSEIGISSTILRLGHILPATNGGSWAPDDVLALFLQTSRAFGMLATDFFDTANWLPADCAASIVSEIVQDTLSRHSSLPHMQVLNAVNPQERPWSSLVGSIAAWCGETVQMVPMSQWVEALHKVDNDDMEDRTRFPALRLLRLFDLWEQRGPFHQYVTKNTAMVSRAMRALSAPDDVMVNNWLRSL